MSIKAKILELQDKHGVPAEPPKQLPLWQESVRALPNEILRCSLFTVRNQRSRRETFEDEDLAMIGNGSISYTGIELRQDDQDVWLAILHLAREQPLGEWVEFTPYRIKKLLGWSRSSIYTDKLRRTLQRLQATTLTLRLERFAQQGRKGATVSLVRKFQWQDEQGERLDRWRVWLEPEIRVLFGDVHYTKLDWETRRRLQGSLSRWLHGYYASHREPLPVHVDTIRQASGARTKSLKRFRQLLREGLAELVRHGFLEDHWIDRNDNVHVRRARPARTAAVQALA